MQNNVIFQNMMKNFNPQMFVPQIFNPEKLHPTVKARLIHDVVYQTKFGLYAKVPKVKSSKFQYVKDFTPIPPNNICSVEVVYEHALTIAEQYAEKGNLNYNNFNQLYPVVLNVVGRNFACSNLENSEFMRDEIMNMRTTFNCETQMSISCYPIRDDECVYNRIITVIKPKNPFESFLGYDKMYRVAMITTCPVKVDTLLDDEKMHSSDFLKTCTVIESIFQVAILKNHYILILTPFGHNKEDNNPVEDIIKIYNFYIYKYGNFFKKIIIGIPPYYPKQIFEMYKNNIIDPNKLTESVDKKYEQMQTKQKLIEKTQNYSFGDESVNNKNKQQNAIQNQNLQQFTPEQMQLLATMLQSYQQPIN